MVRSAEGEDSVEGSLVGRAEGEGEGMGLKAAGAGLFANRG